ncbi:MAG: hypothetical protein N2747_09850 [Chitinophagaceae bacterium]|nr:hypothetical protein [Chitinophagaceae bacterium]
MKSRFLFCFLLMLAAFCYPVKAQTLQQWAQTVQWDGVTHWSRYIRMKPLYLGPNALPIPFCGNGEVANEISVYAGLNGHFMKGDKTQNLFLRANYGVVKDLVSVDLQYIPLEFYQMSDAIKKERRVYYTHYYDNVARGDLMMHINFRLRKKWERFVQLVLRFGFRYPSGSDLETARYTDGMGYFFDISFGKPLNDSWKIIGMAGFYVWEMNEINNRQNDAFLFGSGLEWQKKDWKMQIYTAGYLGYQYRSGDKPIVVRGLGEWKRNKTAFHFFLQQGLHDFRYFTTGIGCRYLLKGN